MSDFWKSTKSYFFLRRYVDWTTRRSFRKIETSGTLPSMDSGAWFIACNHTHTLMDAMVVLQARPGEPTSFGARADVFRNPTAARFLRFCKIVPLARKDRERPEEVAHNRETMEYIDKVVEHGIPFCLFPEGRHRTMHSLLPMRRGIASMAFRSAANRPTYILPVGLEYSDWFHFRGTARINFGTPIDVNAMAASLAGLDDSHRDAALQEELFKRLSSLILYIPDDEHYDEKYAELMAAHPAPERWLRILLAALTFPLWLVAALLSAPLWLPAEIMCRRMIKDPAFQNTVRYAVRLVLWPLWALIWLIIGLCVLPWWGALLLMAAFLPSYSLFYDWLNLVRVA